MFAFDTFMIVDYPRRLDSLGGSALLRNLETLGLLSVSTFFPLCFTTLVETTLPCNSLASTSGSNEILSQAAANSSSASLTRSVGTTSPSTADPACPRCQITSFDQWYLLWGSFYKSWLRLELQKAPFNVDKLSFVPSIQSWYWCNLGISGEYAGCVGRWSSAYLRSNVNHTRKMLPSSVFLNFSLGSQQQQRSES